MHRTRSVALVALLGLAAAMGLPTVAAAEEPPAPVDPVGPVANDDSFSGVAAITAFEPGLLANDVPVEGGGPLLVDVDTVVPPTAGIDFRITGTGTVFFLAGPGFSGVTTFSYRVQQVVDGETLYSDFATVTLLIAPPAVTTLTVEPLLLKLGSGGLGLRIYLGTVSARLTGPGGVPLPAQLITFGGAGKGCEDLTDANGVAGCTIPITNLLGAILTGGLTTATFAGSGALLPSSGQSTLIG